MSSFDKMHAVIEILDKMVTLDGDDRQPEITRVNRLEPIEVDNDINSVGSSIRRVRKADGSNMPERSSKLLAYS